MKTIVYQSYRTQDVPPWITTCMGTVRDWTRLQGYDYRFFDDGFFAYAPDWFRDKAQHAVCPVTDLARLVAARELLGQGYERSIWVDADLLVFDPAAWRIDLQQGFQFCHEVWIWTNAQGGLQPVHRVNNAVSVFSRGSPHLEFFIDACLRIGRHKDRIGKLDVGTQFLSELRRILPFPLLENVGLLTPTMMQELLDGRAQPHLDVYARALRAPLACANLCGSFQGQPFQGVATGDVLYAAVVDGLLASRGALFNRLRGLPPG
jgi:hypothetical protein